MDFKTEFNRSTTEGGKENKPQKESGVPGREEAHRGAREENDAPITPHLHQNGHQN